MLCEYGCNREATIKLKCGKWCCSISQNKCPAIRTKNSNGLKKTYIEHRHLLPSEFDIDAKKKMGWSKGKTKFTNESLNKRGKRLSKKYARKELSGSFLGRKHKKESKEKIRQHIIDRIKDDHGEFIPRMGKREREILDREELNSNCRIDRHFTVLNYFPDGYCHETNTVYEVYEAYHFMNDDIKKRDQIRQEEICEVLNCKFIIIIDIESLVE